VVAFELPDKASLPLRLSRSMVERSHRSLWGVTQPAVAELNTTQDLDHDGIATTVHAHILFVIMVPDADQFQMQPDRRLFRQCDGRTIRQVYVSS